MRQNTKEKILYSTLKLVSELGLGSVSMSMIADSVGIKKASIYNHFVSKEELISKMYQFLREKSKDGIKEISLDNLQELSAVDILTSMVKNYIAMCESRDIKMFYSIIYSERTKSKICASILMEETQKMIDATTQIFEYLKNNKKLKINNVKMCASNFALTIHSLIDNEIDSCLVLNKKFDSDRILQFVIDYCAEFGWER